MVLIPCFFFSFFPFSFSLRRHCLEYFRSGVTQQALLPPPHWGTFLHPHFGTLLLFDRKKTPAISSLVDSHRKSLKLFYWAILTRQLWVYTAELRTFLSTFCCACLCWCFCCSTIKGWDAAAGVLGLAIFPNKTCLQNQVPSANRSGIFFVHVLFFSNINSSMYKVPLRRRVGARLTIFHLWFSGNSVESKVQIGSIGLEDGFGLSVNAV